MKTADPKKLPCSVQPFKLEYWIGLDGYAGAGVSDLLQAGVGQDVSSSQRDIYPWSPVELNR